MTPLAIFDLDETITRRPTFLRWVLFWVSREAPWRAPLLPAAALASGAYRLGLIGRTRLKSFSATVGLGQAITPAQLARAAHAFVERELATNLLSDARDRIAAEQAAGRRVILASASFEAYVRAFAERLGAEAAIGTRMTPRSDGRWRPAVDGENCYGEEKLRRIKEWLAEQGMAREALHIRAYSDHLSDAPLLAWADEAVAVNPAPDLAALAAERGWEIVRWR